MTENSEKRASVLVVDDEMIVTSLIRDTLLEEEYDIDTANSGAEALDLVKTKIYDLIITDIRMPQMDGITLVKQVKVQLPNIGIVFMTGYANLQSAKNAIKQGASDYIMKPFELSEIRQAAKSALDMKRAADEIGSDHHLDNLSDLNRMLFEAGDRRGLIIASLKFAMIHQRSDLGTVLFGNEDLSQVTMTTFDGDKVSEKELPVGPIKTLQEAYQPDESKKPYLVSSIDDFPFYQENPNPILKDYFIPEWLGSDDHMIFVPVIRGGIVHCCMMIKLEEDTIRLRETNLKFLYMVASQLAITLENLVLLNQSRQAYARLQLLQDQTIKLEKMATRGEISAQIGHELNNFLGVLAGNLALLEINVGREQYDKLDKYVGTMNSTIEKIKVFTDNLMDFSSISSKKELILFDQLLEEVVEFMQPQKRYDGITIRLRHTLKDVPFQADTTQIQQLLYNLFNNAADAMSESVRRQITVDLESTDQDDRFRFRISDTGEGIEPALLEKAFREQFTTKDSGHGFGLMVCKQIIESHGGEFKVESAPGQGTTISILFPLARRTQPILIS